MDRCRDLLLSGLDELGLALGDIPVAKLLTFIQLIDKWNKAFNLTSIRDREAMVGLHLLDSLSVLPHIAGSSVVDIGTGAGLPGIPLAIAKPDVQFTLLDSNAKKTRFVQQAVLELKLANVRVCHCRVESYRADPPFDVVITRAFTNLPDMLRLTLPLLGEDGILLAMKGQYPDREIAEAGVEAIVIPIKVPGIDAERCLVRISKPTQQE